MPHMDPDFLAKLLLLLVDKLLLGLVVGSALLVVGFFANQKLEVFKRNQLLTAELAKKRIEAYARVFAHIFDIESAYGTWLEHPDATTEKSYRQALAATRAEVRASRFFLGEHWTSLVVSLADTYDEDVDAFEREIFDNIKDTKASDRTQRLNNLRDRLFKELPVFAQVPQEAGALPSRKLLSDEDRARLAKELAPPLVSSR